MRRLLPLPTYVQGDFIVLQDRFLSAADDEEKAWFFDKKNDQCFFENLARVWLGSEYFFEVCCRKPVNFMALFSMSAVSSVDEQPTVFSLEQALQGFLAGVDTEETVMRVLREFRQQQMLRIIWRDITRLASTLETTAALTALADVCIAASVDFLYPRLCVELGVPHGADTHTPQSFLVLAMGKMGAFELNLSSDIDLIFAYDESGETQGVTKPISNRDFFMRLGQKLIRLLDQKTVDGFVFRVDMRLRPYGDSGALVLNYDAMEQYYQQQGRDWERYAMIKARLVYGDKQQAAPLLDMLRRFTFRRYLDFSSIDSLRELKRQIEREVNKKGMGDNVKLGKGGIREIEFIVQMFQLIHGGRDTALQPAPVIPMLSVLEQKQLLSGADAAVLRDAYLFLRDVEHLLQAWRDEQTQMLPKDEARWVRLAWLMGFVSVEDFSSVLQQHRAAVQRIFSGIIAPPQTEAEEQTSPWQYLWDGVTDDDVGIAEWNAAGIFDEKLMHDVHAWHSDKILLGLATAARARLDRFMPLLLKALSACERPSVVFERLLPLLRAVLRRSSYLVLLLENPQALKQLVLLVEASTWIAEQLAAWPVLLDELIDERNLYRDIAPSREELSNLLRQQMLRVPEDDLEEQMDALRHFKRAHSLRAAACEVTGRLPLMKVSDYLTFMAEVILDYVLHLAWRTTCAKHGTPLNREGNPCDLDFIIVGYGKLGGLELGHGSDLDLVFIHGGGSGETIANVELGQVSLENAQFFTRMGHRIIHMLSTRTVNGVLYEVDMRLRPSGNSGLLVASFASFERYEEKDAWTWEHQALTRTRVVAGCTQLAQQYDVVRARVLGRQRDIKKLCQDVVDMRDKMRAQLDKSDAAHFDLKQGVGGIVDLEFIVQFSVLAWAHDYPALLKWPDNIRILEEMAAAQLLEAETAETLMETYRRLRARGHRRTLLGEPMLIAADELLPERAVIVQAWQTLVLPHLQ